MDTSAPLIPRANLFGNPSRMMARLSPDGKWLGWIAPRNGVLNVYAAPVSNPAESRPLTAEKTRPIRFFWWAPDSRQVLFINDKGGDENFLFYGVDVASGAQRTLTPFEETRALFVGQSHRVPDRILVGLNNRDPRWHDVHALHLASGTLTPVLINTGNFASFMSDANLHLRVASRQRPDGGFDFFRIEGGTVEDQPFTSVPLEDSQSTGPARFTVDGETLYWVDSRGRDTAALIAQDFATGKTKVIAEDARADIGERLHEPRTGNLQAYAVNYLKTEWIALDPAIQSDLDFLSDKLEGEVAITSQSYANDLWTVAVDPVTEPASAWLFDRKSRALTQLFVTRPELEGTTLAPMHPVEIKLRDGLNAVSYLTLPAGTDPKSESKPDRPLPMVLFVHGGPWARDEYGYHPYHQWLANRGFAVLSTNFRGSTGFGKSYISAGDLQWGTGIVDDLIDAVNWAIEERIADPKKIAIMGGSFGGYATLAGLAFRPDVFACGVDIVGPSNLNTLLSTIPPYWEGIKLQFYKRMGDPTTEDGKKLLRDHSPLYQADAINKPLLIGQGANDPRVNQAESDQIVGAMAKKNIPVTYVVFPDEGHGFARPENNIAFNAIAEQFLVACLGGRAEPIGDALAPSSVEVRHGAEFAPGLSEALKR
jgi:dipeptidyl aminopeptidase/acylaminoacyl peptidase